MKRNGKNGKSLEIQKKKKAKIRNETKRKKNEKQK
jgi:hypothetical protein